jgi:hypothetical protein
VPIPKGTLRVPGFEGVGTIVRFGANPEVAKRFSEGQRVAFFPATGSWAEYVVIRYNSLLPVPNKISNEIAAQTLINSITTSVLIKAGHNSLKAPITLPVWQRPTGQERKDTASVQLPCRILPGLYRPKPPPTEAFFLPPKTGRPNSPRRVPLA